MHIFEIVYMHGIRRSKDARIAAVTRIRLPTGLRSAFPNRLRNLNFRDWRLQGRFLYMTDMCIVKRVGNQPTYRHRFLGAVVLDVKNDELNNNVYCALSFALFLLFAS
jgi:hypothetical protein